LVNCLDPSGGLTSVVADEHGAGSAAAGVLIDAGHTSLGVIAGPSDSMQSPLRLEGIEAAAAGNRIGVSVQAVPNRDIDSGFAAASTLLNASEAPTALICSHERLAVGAVLAAANLGVAIPADLSLVSMDDGEQLASQLIPQLTTIERPDRAMAEQAVTVTLQVVDDENGGEIRQLTLDCSPAIRDSVARPRRPNRRPCLPADR
jgi:LacI family transcriptional regulator